MPESQPALIVTTNENDWHSRMLSIFTHLRHRLREEKEERNADIELQDHLHKMAQLPARQEASSGRPSHSDYQRKVGGVCVMTELQEKVRLGRDCTQC